MEKWADYVITCVTYDKDHERIISCGVRVDNGDTIGPEVKQDRETIAKNLEKFTYITAYEGEENKWKKGDTVIKYKIDDTYFIRTDGNKVKSDNLGKLPEC
jgi:hypothetical protein